MEVKKGFQGKVSDPIEAQLNNYEIKTSAQVHFHDITKILKSQLPNKLEKQKMKMEEKLAIYKKSDSFECNFVFSIMHILTLDEFTLGLFTLDESHSEN